jgi:hypothetical protein
MGVDTPLSSCWRQSSATNSPAVCRWTVAVMRIEPGPAALWTRAAVFVASPNTSPLASTASGRTQGRRASTAPCAVGGVSNVEVGKRALDGERGVHAPLGVICCGHPNRAISLA